MVDRKRIITGCLFLLIIVHYVACDGGTDPVDPASLRDPREKNLRLTPRDDAEAENIALCLSGELIAPGELYERVHQDLEYIRVRHGSEHEWLNKIHFISPWVPSMICIKFDLFTGGEVADGTYDAWDSLNVAHELTEIRQFFPHTNSWWILYFSGKRHPKRLSEIYDDLPGVLVAEANPVTYSFYNLFPRNSCFRDESEISYLFGRGEGDCWAGCPFGEFWFFISDNENVSFAGHWNLFAPPQAGEDCIPAPDDPELLEKAKCNMVEFRKF
ncbi:MAG: hypothetical protein KAV42_08995 [Candidatus Krumholzibacteria bacterium]|nr:hypothetical protein [Candidatus Krumholzibacteria bacterium]